VPAKLGTLTQAQRVDFGTICRAAAPTRELGCGIDFPSGDKRHCEAAGANRTYLIPRGPGRVRQRVDVSFTSKRLPLRAPRHNGVSRQMSRARSLYVPLPYSGYPQLGPRSTPLAETN